jgi:pilus assembly protein Flp/PilA
MFARISQSIRRFLQNEDGPTAVEYAVMLALIIVVCISAIQALGTNASATFTSVGNAIGGTSGS